MFYKRPSGSDTPSRALLLGPIYDVSLAFTSAVGRNMNFPVDRLFIPFGLTFA